MELVKLARKSDSSVRIVRAYLANSPDSDYDLVICDVLESLERVDVGDLPEQFGFRIRTGSIQSRCRNLHMKMTELVICVVVPTLHKEGRSLQLVDTGRNPREGRPRDTNRQI